MVFSPKVYGNEGVDKYMETTRVDQTEKQIDHEKELGLCRGYLGMLEKLMGMEKQKETTIFLVAI